MSASRTDAGAPSTGSRRAAKAASVTIVDDHLLFATALADLVRALPDFTVASVAATGADAIATVAEHRPDLVLLDFHLPGVLATDILPDLRAASPNSRIIILTSDTSGATKDSASAAGVDGFLTKEQALDDVAEALRSALGTEAPPPEPEPEPAPAPVAAQRPEPPKAPPPEPKVEEKVAAPPPPPVAAPTPAPTPREEEPRPQPAAPRITAPVRTESPPPQAPTAPAPAGRGALIGVYGAKGGVGTTTVAVNLGVQLARNGESAVVVDLDLAFGDVGMFLDLEGGPTISDVAMRRFDAQQLSRMALQHSSGLRVVTTPATPAPVRPDAALVQTAVDDLRAHFGYVICDLPRVLGPLTIAMLRAVDMVVFVTTPELPALRDLERVLARGSLGLRERALLVVNRHPAKSGVQLRDVEYGIGLKVAATIPSDGVHVTDSINRGMPVAGTSKPAGRAFKDLADRVKAAVPASQRASLGR